MSSEKLIMTTMLTAWEEIDAHTDACINVSEYVQALHQYMHLIVKLKILVFSIKSFHCLCNKLMEIVVLRSLFVFENSHFSNCDQ